jgi:monoamine oxidase
MFTFLPPLTLPEAAPNQVITIFSLANMPVHAQPVLVVYLAGAWSTYLRTLPHAEIADLFRQHYIPLLPNYSEACAINDLFCTNWTSDPFSYGSYTHVPVGSLDGVEDLRILGEKIMSLSNGDGGLWFAGEHAGTADLATVNGAMASGASAAINVLKAFNLEVPQTGF